jgi:hypothetical protein
MYALYSGLCQNTSWAKEYNKTKSIPGVHKYLKGLGHTIEFKHFDKIFSYRSKQELLMVFEFLPSSSDEPILYIVE